MPDDLVLVNPDDTVESPHHRRQHWGDMKSLAASVAKSGVLQPARGRRKNGHLEIVFGHRRRRAAKTAGVKLPILIGDMTDDQVVEAQLEENLEREDMHPMDEAEMFGQLAEMKYSVEQIAEKRGCEPAYVRQRMKLLALDRSVRKKFVADEFDADVAFLIARIPAAAAQKAAAKELGDHLGDRHGFGLEDARRVVKSNFMLDLKSASFDIKDAKLVAAGACSSCPKRTGQQREMFAEVAKKEDLCLDPGCYRKKADAHFALLKKTAKKDGLKVLSKKDAKGIFVGYYHRAGPRPLSYAAKFVDAKAKVGYRGAKQIQKTWARALGEHAPEPVHCQDPDGMPRMLYPKATAERALVKAGVVTKAAASSSEPTSQEKAEREKRNIKKLTAKRAIAAVAETIKTVEPERLWHAMAVGVMSGAALNDAAKAVGAPLPAPAGETNAVIIATLQVALADNLEQYGTKNYGDRFLEMAQLIGINVAGLETVVRAERKEAKAKKKQKKPTKKIGAKKTKRARK